MYIIIYKKTQTAYIKQNVYKKKIKKSFDKAEKVYYSILAVKDFLLLHNFLIL